MAIYLGIHPWNMIYPIRIFPPYCNIASDGGKGDHIGVYWITWSHLRNNERQDEDDIISIPSCVYGPKCAMTDRDLSKASTVRTSAAESKLLVEAINITSYDFVVIYCTLL